MNFLYSQKRHTSVSVISASTLASSTIHSNHAYLLSVPLYVTAAQPPARSSRGFRSAHFVCARPLPHQRPTECIQCECCCCHRCRAHCSTSQRRTLSSEGCFYESRTRSPICWIGCCCSFADCRSASRSCRSCCKLGHWQECCRKSHVRVVGMSCRGRTVVRRSPERRPPCR